MGGFGAASGSLMILSMCWRGTTRHGALAGMIAGALVKNYTKMEGS